MPSCSTPSRAEMPHCVNQVPITANEFFIVAAVVVALVAIAIWLAINSDEDGEQVAIGDQAKENPQTET